MHLHSHLPSVPLRPPPPVPPLFPYTTLFRSPGERPEHLRAALRIVGTHGSMLVDLLRPQLEVRTAAGATHVPFGEPGPADPSAIPPGGPSDALSGIAESARSGRRLTITW